MANRIRTKSIDVPEDKKGFIIGRHHTGLEEISKATKAKVFVSKESGKICAKGTDEQIKLAGKMIQDKLNQKVDVMVPKESIGLVIGKGRESLKRIEKQTQTRIGLSSKNIENGVFTITGSQENCQRAKTLITDIVNQNQPAEGNVEVEVPQEFVGLVIGRGGENIKQIQMESQTTIRSLPKQFQDGREIEVFTITGSPENRQKAKDLIREVMEKKSYNESTFEVESDHVGLLIGKRGRNLHNIETKSDTKILSPSKEDQDVNGYGKFTIIGSPENRARAKALMMESIISCKEYITRNELGGDRHFAILDQNYENVHFDLKKTERDAPKLNGYMKGERYRIKTDSVNDMEGFSETELSLVRDILLGSLGHLHQVKNEKELAIDLWCHLGRVFVHNVDEGEEIEGLKIDDVKQRLPKIANNLNKVTASDDLFSENETEDDEGWKVTFEEGIDPEYNTRLEQLTGDDQDSFLHHHHTQWRYDYAFTTPSGRYVRFKLWENLRDTEPPPEVKYLMKQVFVEGHEESVVAWLCYPSTTIVRGEIMTPSSTYDCRLKLRAGKRRLTQASAVAEEENAILCDYLSKCTLRTEDGRRHLDLPEELPVPEEFGCRFYRSAEERILKTSDCDGETFTVIVLDEQGWDSDSSEKRAQKQFGIRVVLDSWSQELLSGEWEPEKIVNKLQEFMKFFYAFRDMLLKEQ